MTLSGMGAPLTMSMSGRTRTPDLITRRHLRRATNLFYTVRCRQADLCMTSCVSIKLQGTESIVVSGASTRPCASRFMSPHAYCVPEQGDIPLCGGSVEIREACLLACWFPPISRLYTSISTTLEQLNTKIDC